MPRILIVVGTDEGQAKAPTITQRSVAALRQAISSPNHSVVEVVGLNELNSFLTSLPSSTRWLGDWLSNDVLLCPLTLSLPLEKLHFEASAVYQACRDVPALRASVASLGYATGIGGLFWLPIVLTAKGPLYGEVIGVKNGDRNFYQPYHLADALRQQLYQMGYSLLQFLSAPPATYLVQFGFQDQNIYFDSLCPFPASPALASLGVQNPDLFACHLHCLTRTPILDLSIVPQLPHN